MNPNVAFMQGMYAAFNRGDMPVVTKHFTPDCEWIYEGPGEVAYFGRRRGHEEIANFFETMARKETGHKLEMTHFVAEGDTVAAFGRFTATSKSTGRTFSVPMAHLVRIRDGKIYHHQALADTHAVAGAHRA